MANVEHKDIAVGIDSSHPPGYVQSGDPGAVGAYKVWIDTTGGTGLWVKKIRNAANSGWETVGGGAGGGPATQIDETSGPTTLDIAAVADGEYLRRSGTDIIGDTPTGGGGGTERALVDPTGLSWSWLNQGSATITTNGASLALQGPADAADSFRIRYTAVPSKPYSVIIHLKPALIGANYASCAVGWLQSSDAKLAMALYLADSGINGNFSLGVRKYTNPTTFGADYLVGFAASFLWHWVRLSDAAAGNRTVEVSPDGNNWILIHSVATDDYLTPDNVFFAVNPRNATYATGLTIDSWEEL